MRSTRVPVLLLIGLLSPCARAAPAPPPEEARALEQVRKQVRAGDWKAALGDCRAFLGAVRSGRATRGETFEWQHLESYLSTAVNYPDTNVAQKRARAKAAERLGLYELALEQYLMQAGLSRPDDVVSVRSEAAMCAYWAGVEATRQGRYDQAVRRFEQMRDLGGSWVADAGRTKAELVRRLAKSPNDVALRMEFAEKFWSGNVPALGRYPVEARRLLVDALAHKPTREQRLEILRRAQDWSQELDEVDAAEGYARQVAKEADAEAGDEMFLRLAVHQLSKQRFAEARALLAPLVDSGRTTRAAGQARLALADAHGGLGDGAKVLRTLEAAAEIGGVSHPALLRLARHHFAGGAYRKALDCFTRYEPQSDCKTCLRGMREDKERSRVLCLLHLKEHAAAVELCLAQMRQSDSSPTLGLLLSQVYAEAGQTPDLLKLVDRAPALRNHPVLAELVRIRGLAAKGDVAALIAICQDSNWTQTDTARESARDWKCRAAAESLALCGGKEVDALRQAIQTAQKNTSWLIYALGKSSAPAALEVLTELAKVEKSYNCGNIAYALTMKGKAGRGLLERLAREDTNGMRGASKRWLEELARPSPELRDWPRPARGSLPKAEK